MEVSVWGIKARFGADASNGSLFGLSSLRVLPTLTDSKRIQFWNITSRLNQMVCILI